jgi:5-methylcytosine-specific restriction endonuclease McrBC regulatory subunit McrC
VIDEKKWILDAKYKMGYADPMQIELSDATRMMYYLLAKKEYLGIILFPSYNGIISSDELEERVSKSIQIIKPSISNKEPLVIKIGVALPLKKAQ